MISLRIPLKKDMAIPKEKNVMPNSMIKKRREKEKRGSHVRRKIIKGEGDIQKEYS
jgi:hypothetical protein